MSETLLIALIPSSLALVGTLATVFGGNRIESGILPLFCFSVIIIIERI